MKPKERDHIFLGILSAIGICFGTGTFFRAITDIIMDMDIGRLVDNPILGHRFFPQFLQISEFLVIVLLGLWVYKKIKLSKLFSKTFITTLILYLTGYVGMLLFLYLT